MKTKHPLIVLYLSILTVKLLAQPSITSNISGGNSPQFLFGLTGVVNQFTIDDGGIGASDYVLKVLDANDDVLQILPLNTVDIDMGGLDSTATQITVEFYDNGGDSIHTSIQPYNFSIKPLPLWASNPDPDVNGEIELISFNESTGVADVNYIYPIYKKSATIPAGVTGLGGKEFGIKKNDFVFTGTYRVSTGEGTIANSEYQFQLNAFDLVDFPNPPYTFGLDTISPAVQIQPQLNSDLELEMDAHYSRAMQLLNFESKEWKYSIPAAPIFKIGVKVGFQLIGGFDLNAKIGQGSNGEYGFIGNLGTPDISSVSVGGKAVGTIWGSISLIHKRLAGIEGKLDLTGRIGASYRFRTVPDFQDEIVWGGDLQLKGSLRLTGAAKKVICFLHNCGENGEIASGTIWPTDGSPYEINGGMPANFPFLVASSQDHGTRSQTFSAALTNDVLDDLTQQSFSAKGEKVGVVWIEEDDANQYLFFSELDSSASSFSQTHIVSDTNFSVSSPKVALMSDGSAIIVWEQNKFLVSDLDSNMSIENYLDAQDTWFAIYDKSSDSIVYKAKISDQTDLPEGMPSVTISNSDKAIITWLAEDIDYGYTDVWHSEITRDGNQWLQSDPYLLTYDYPGDNHHINVSFTDSNQAVATWIYDPDEDDSTGGNMILSAFYDGTDWDSAVVVISPDDANISYKELSMNFNGEKGALAYTYTDDDDSDRITNNLKVEIYNAGTDSWDPNQFYDYPASSDEDIRMPAVSISDTGIIAVSFQTVELFSDTNSADEGQMNIVLKDLNSGSNNDWVLIENNQLVCDSNIYCWNMDIAFNDNNTLYTLSHETDTVTGNIYEPRYGKLFGDPSMGLVLRGFRIGNDLSIDTVSVIPETPTAINSPSTPPIEQLTLLVYPNPFAESTNIEFHVPATQQITLMIYDLFGREVGTPVSQKLSQGTYKTVFEAPLLPKGLYIVKLTSGNSVKTCRIILQ